MSTEMRHRASLVLNVVLALVAVGLVVRRSKPAVVTPSAFELASAKSPVSARPQPPLPRYAETASPAEHRRWLVDQLRAMRVPDDLVARIAMESLDKEWNRYSAEVLWKTHGDDDALSAVQLEIDMKWDDQMRAALGNTAFQAWDRKNVLQDIMATKVKLTESEADAIYAFRKKRQQRELQLRLALQRGEIDPADMREASGKAEADLAAEIKSRLGDERYASSLEPDESVTAADVRQNIAGVNPTESQFEELLKTQQQWNERRAAIEQQLQDGSAPSAACAEQIKALEQARDEEYRRVLGSDVFDALQKEQDGGYAKMKKYGNVWGLDDNNINAVYGAMQYYQKNAQDYRARARALEAQGQQVDWSAINNNLQVFKDQSRQSLVNYLGQDRFNRLQQNGVLYQFEQSASDSSP